jgi:hypothetical protein
MDQRITITISPESNASCVGCCLLRGVRSAPCLAGFQPEYRVGDVTRPQQCRDAAETSELISLWLAQQHKE